MVSSAPTSALRQVFENRLSQLAADVETIVAQERERGRSESAEALNQAVRRIRQAEDLDGLSTTLTDTAAGFGTCAALFRIRNEAALGTRLRGLSEEDVEHFRDMEIPLSTAAALAGAVETRDPVTAAATATEVSGRMALLAAHQPEDRVSICPLVVRGEVPALLYCWGAVQAPAIELLTQVAAAVWAELSPRPAPVQAEFVQIAAPSPAAPEPAAPRRTWDNLPPEEQRIHLRGQRFARVRVAEMRLHEPEAVLAGRTQRDIYSALRKSIDAAREEFRGTYFARCASMVDYFHLEILTTLANDDPDVLGKDYPGPMV